jgi:hypothetical protein
LIARGADTGLPVLAATTSPQVASDLVELTNVLVAYRMNDAAARQLAGDAETAGRLAALRDGEFLLAVRRPHRVVPRGVLVRAKMPQFRPGSRPGSRSGAGPGSVTGSRPAVGPRAGLKGGPPA